MIFLAVWNNISVIPTCNTFPFGTDICTTISLNKKNMSPRTFFVLIIFSSYKPLIVFSQPNIVSNFSYWLKIVNTCFVFSDKIRKLSSIKFGKHFLQLFSELYPYPFLASVNMSGIHLAELLCIFKIHFKVKCTRNNDMSKAFAISRSEYLASL